MVLPTRATGTADLADAVRRLARASVLVVGDAMLDRFVYGAVLRVSPEAPVPILTVERDVAVPGGAGNVVRNLTALRAAVAFVSVVGDDQAGSDLTGLIGGQPNVEPWLLVQGGRTTTTKTRFMAHGQHLLRADHEIIAAVHPKMVERLLRIATDALSATAVTVLSDYGKGLLTGDLPARLIAAAKAADRPVVVDPKGRDFARYAGADLVVPNRRELAEATGLPVVTEAELATAATALREAHGFGAVLVTLGASGMMLLAEGQPAWFPAEAPVVSDVTGAGDTVVATVAAALAAGLELPVAARLANIAAGVVVGRIGTASAQEADLLAALSPQGSALRKVMDRAQAADQVERWRQRGWTVGFVDGRSDRLLPEHAEAFLRARAHCDRLVVGVPSDGSVRRTAGAAPDLPAAARAAMLAGLQSVDLVCVFDEETSAETLNALHPALQLDSVAKPAPDGLDMRVEPSV